jgi:arylsulfatase A-like enzyme
VRDNASPPLAEEFTTLAEVLRSRGVKTAAFVGSSVLAPSRGLAQGFGTYREAPLGCAGMPPRRRAAEVIDDAVAWLGSSDHDPFYVWIHLFDAHRPYDLPDEFRNRYFDPYLASIAYEDAQLGRVLRHLEARQLLHDTLIVVTGDHGESLGDHGEDAHGILLYQEALRVPLIIYGQGVGKGRTSSVVRLIDVMPTVLDMFGIPAPQMDGVSLAEIGNESAAASREVYAESMYPLRFGWSQLRSLRADRFKLIDAPRPELYDLTTDALEQHNVIADYSQIADAMRRRVRAIDPAAAAPARPSPAADRWVLDRIGSLGYVSGTVVETPYKSGDLPDPKDRLVAYNQLTNRHIQNAAYRRSLCR